MTVEPARCTSATTPARVLLKIGARSGQSAELECDILSPMTSLSFARVRPFALLAATALAASALVGLGASSASATGTTFKTHKPSISGTVKVGHTVGIAMSNWSPKPTTKTYQWLEDGVDVPDATNKTYALTTADIGKSLSVEVTGTKDGYTSATVDSAAKVVAGYSFTKTSTPKISGSPKVGLTLTATSGAWTPAPASLVYQWKRNKVAIPDATGSTYTVQGSDAGKTITVTATATLATYQATSKTSAKTATVGYQAFITKNGAHKLSGTKPLAAGTYVTTSTSLKFCYWERDSSPTDIISNDIVTGQAIVTVNDTDYELWTDGCGTWTRLSDKPTAPKTTFGSGDYAVGQQIAAGTYTAKGSKSCFWFRLSGFTGIDDATNDSSTIIDEGDGKAPVVTIQGSDAGFESYGCGTWKPAP